MRAGVARDLELSVVGACPHHAFLTRRLGDRKHDARVLDADVVRRQPSGALLAAPIVQRQVGTDHLPRLAAIGRPVHVLRPRVDRVVIVRRNRQGKGPVEAVLQIGCGHADRDLRPDLDLARLPRALVEALHRAAETAVSRSARPHDVAVDRIGNRPAAFAARDRVPHAARNRPRGLLVGLFGEAAIARTACRRTVLSVAVDVVWNLIVGRHVIHLRHWQLDLMPAPAAVDREAQAVVVGDDEPVAVGRIDPHVVVVADRRQAAREIDARLSAVERLGEFRRQKVRLVLIVRLDREPRVVVRTAAQPSIRADQIPGLSAVVAAPERAALRRRAVRRRQPIAGLDQRVDAAGIAARDLR